MDNSLERRLDRALKAIDIRGRKEVKRLERELRISESKLRDWTNSVYTIRDKLARAQVKVDSKEIANKISERLKRKSA